MGNAWLLEQGVLHVELSGFEILECISHLLGKFLVEHGTLPRFSCPGAHAQNGVAEHKHRHLEVARALMIVTSLLPHFWVEVVSTSTYVINIHPSRSEERRVGKECRN